MTYTNAITIECPYWRTPNRCTVAGLTVSPGTCAACLRDGKQGRHLTRRMRGLGDVVARVTSAIGIKPCSGCKERQAKLNKLVPFVSSESGNH